LIGRALNFVELRPFCLNQFELLESGFALMTPGVCVRALRITDESFLGELVILNRVRSTCSSRATCFPQHSVILPAETVQMGKVC
jgi:hypothetical protein